MASHFNAPTPRDTPSPLGNSFTTNEVEFLAEDELIQIVPRFRGATLNFVRGNFGPFRPQVPVWVPLWLAIALKKQRKCNIQSPRWMTVENLKTLKQLERESEMQNLQPLPNHYMEFASILLQHAPDDIPNVESVRSLLEDVENLRQHKIRQGLQRLGEQQIEEALHLIKLNNTSAMELHSVRPILLSTLFEFYKLHSNANKESGDPFNSRDTYNARLATPAMSDPNRLRGYAGASQDTTQGVADDGAGPRLRRFRPMGN